MYFNREVSRLDRARFKSYLRATATDDALMGFMLAAYTYLPSLVQSVHQ